MEGDLETRGRGSWQSRGGWLRGRDTGTRLSLCETGYIWGVCLSTSVLRRQTYTAQGAHPRTVLAMESSFITTGSSGPMTCCCLGRAPRQTHGGPGGVRHPRYGTARPSDPQVKAVPAYAERASLSGEFPPSGRGVTAYRFALQSGIVLRIEPGMQGCDGGETVVTSRPPNKARFIYRRHCQLHIEVADGITTRRGRLDEHAQTGPWQTCEVWPRPRIYGGALVSLKRHSALSLPPPHSLTPVSPASTGAGCARHVVTPKSPGPLFPLQPAWPWRRRPASQLRSMQAGTAVGGSCVTSRVPGTHSQSRSYHAAHGGGFVVIPLLLLLVVVPQLKLTHPQNPPPCDCQWGRRLRCGGFLWTLGRRRRPLKRRPAVAVPGKVERPSMVFLGVGRVPTAVLVGVLVVVGCGPDTTTTTTTATTVAALDDVSVTLPCQAAYLADEHPQQGHGCGADGDGHLGGAPNYEVVPRVCDASGPDMPGAMMAWV